MEHKEELAQLITLEQGKPVREAIFEVRALCVTHLTKDSCFEDKHTFTVLMFCRSYMGLIL